MENFLSLRELSRLFIRPKETIRKIVAIDPNRYFLWMATVYGFLWILLAIALPYLACGYINYYIFYGAPFFALPLGYILLNVITFFYHCFGRLLRGIGSYKEVRAAITWVHIPWTLFFVSCVIGIIIFCRENPPSHANFYMVSFLTTVEIISSVWTLILLCNTLAEVERFSAWRALSVCFFATLSWVACFLMGLFFLFRFYLR